MYCTIQIGVTVSKINTVKIIFRKRWIKKKRPTRPKIKCNDRV